MENIRLFRPFSDISKKEIEEYARTHSVEYREDSTNADTKYLRNKIRHDILPGFEMVNPEYRRAIANFIDYSAELQGWIDDEVRLFL
jgi:tRNA(Ile)-lysidine synthase